MPCYLSSAVYEQNVPDGWTEVPDAVTDEEGDYIGPMGCVMYAKRTIFDLVLPRIMTGEILNKGSLKTVYEGQIRKIY